MIIYDKYIISIFLGESNMDKILADNEGTIITKTCKRCDYVWIPRKEDIKQCPRCKNIAWNKERKVREGE